MPRGRFAGRRTARRQRAREEAKREGEKRGGADHLFTIGFTITSEDVPAEVLILYDVGKLFRDVRAVHLHIFLLQVGRLEGNFVQHLFKDRVKASGADVFRLLVDHDGVAGEGGDGVVAEIQLYAFRVQQRDVLLDEGILRFRENAHKIALGERREFDADRQPALQLRDQVR